MGRLRWRLDDGPCTMRVAGLEASLNLSEHFAVDTRGRLQRTSKILLCQLIGQSGYGAWHGVSMARQITVSHRTGKQTFAARNLAVCREDAKKKRTQVEQVTRSTLMHATSTSDAPA
jgi:hypothetical protein